jgi:hypothetical protein
MLQQSPLMNPHPTFRFRLFLSAMLMLIITGAASMPARADSAKTDTTWSVTFKLNMSYALTQGIFDPDSDFVYVGLDHGIEAMKLVPGPGYVYSASLFDALDSAETYSYKFRINDSTWESVHREFTAMPGTVTITTWWNNETPNQTRFIINMEYAAADGSFDPTTDSVSIVGTMTAMKGSPAMQRIDTTLRYAINYSLDPWTVQEYKYMISGDTNRMELRGRPARLVFITDSILEVQSDFDNYNPGRRQMTFRCNMGYYIKTLRFDPGSQWVDVAGNFNAGAYQDVLFDTDGDSVYSLDLMIDTAWFAGGPLSFRFRIDSDWSQAELTGKPDRVYNFHDTTGQNPNMYYCWFNDLDPSVPTRPRAYEVAIQGKLIHKQILSGTYLFEDVNGAREDTSQYRWYRSSNAQGTDAVLIDSAVKITYTVDTVDIGKWLVFEVIPIADKPDSAIGYPVRVVAPTPIGGVGIDEVGSIITKVYPNPLRDLITIEARRELATVELIDLAGRVVLTITVSGANAVRFSAGHLPGGLYLLRAKTLQGETGVTRLMKQ